MNSEYVRHPRKDCPICGGRGFFIVPVTRNFVDYEDCECMKRPYDEIIGRLMRAYVKAKYRLFPPDRPQEDESSEDYIPF